MPTIEKFCGEGITEDMIKDSATLFSNNYGVWSKAAASKMGRNLVEGSRIKISPKLLRQKCIPDGADNIYVRFIDNSPITNEPMLVGNVLATAWEHEGRKIIWITQLCVSSDFRNRGVAKRLLETLRVGECCYGILSSHPFAIMTVLSIYGCGSADIDLRMTKEQAATIMASCPVDYVRNAKLRGSLWEGRSQQEDGGAICCADTDFWVDHGEPLKALRIVGEKGITWPFGILPDGCEFLLLVDTEQGKKKRTADTTLGS